jgi:hypothetical protein
LLTCVQDADGAAASWWSQMLAGAWRSAHESPAAQLAMGHRQWTDRIVSELLCVAIRSAVWLLWQASRHWAGQE